MWNPEFNLLNVKSFTLFLLFILAISFLPSTSSNASDQISLQELTVTEITELIDEIGRRNAQWSDDAVTTLIEHGSEPLVYSLLLERLDACSEWAYNRRANILWILFRIEENPQPRFDALLEMICETDRSIMDPVWGVSHHILRRLSLETDKEYIDLLHEHLSNAEQLCHSRIMAVLEAYTEDPKILEIFIQSVLDNINDMYTPPSIYILFNELEINNDLRENQDLRNKLIEILNNGSDSARLNIAENIGAYGLDESVINALYQRLSEDESIGVRSRSLVTLIQIIPVSEISSIIFDLLRSPNLEDNIVALRGMEAIGYAPGFVDEICRIIGEGPIDHEQLYQGSPMISRMYLHNPYSALMAMGEDACVAVPILIQVIEERRIDYRSAIIVLNSMGSCASEAVPALIGVLTSREWSEIEESLEALGSIGPMASPAAQSIIDLINEGNLNYYKIVFDTLSKIEGDPSLIIPELFDMVNRPIRDEYLYFELRELAVGTLSTFRNQASEIVPGLLELLENNPDSRFAIHLHLALYKLGYETEIHRQAIFGYLYALDFNYVGFFQSDPIDDESYFLGHSLMHRAAWACGEMGQDALEVLPRIRLWRELTRSDIIYESHDAERKIMGSIGL